MIGHRPRSLSRASYRLVQAIRAQNDRQRQVDRGLGYRQFATERRQRLIGQGGADAPLHIGPQLDAVRAGEAWDAA